MHSLRKHALIRYTSQIGLFPNYIASLCSYIHPIQHHYNNHHHLLSLLNDFPSSRRVTQQIHSQLTTNGSLNECPNTQFVFVFNNLLRRYAIGEFPQEAIFLYKQALSTSLLSYFDSFTYSFLVKSCANLNQHFLGFQLHGLVVKLGFECHVYVQTALLNMYVDYGLLSYAGKVFDEMPERNLVTWNVMITGLVKWGYLEDALDLFWKMPSRNVVSWTGMIDGFARMKNYVGAFSLFREMVGVAGIMPTDVTLLAVSTAIAGLWDLKSCNLVHAYSEKCGFSTSNIQVTNCLVDAYAKCGCIQSAMKMFEEISADRRSLVSWTSIVSGFAMHGMANEAAESFEKMLSSGVRTNRVTYLSVLNAYSHGGLVEEGLKLFDRMVDEGCIAPDLKHYGSVIDMLGRAGRLKEAEDIASQIPGHIDNVIIWRTLLGACSIHGHAEMAERVSRRIQELETEYGGDYVLMSNILKGHGQFTEAENVRTAMNMRSVHKVSGLSSV